MRTEIINPGGKTVIEVPSGASVLIIPRGGRKDHSRGETATANLGITDETVLREVVQDFLDHGEEDAYLNSPLQTLKKKWKLAAASGVDFKEEFLPDLMDKIEEIGGDLNGPRLGENPARLLSIADILVGEAEDIWTKPTS